MSGVLRITPPPPPVRLLKSRYGVAKAADLETEMASGNSADD